jgi:hypothetical protein
MWLYVPRPPASASAPASEGSTSDSMPPAEWSLWCTSSGKPMLRPSSWPGWKRRSYVRRLSGPTSPPSTLARWWASWISSLAERRARTCPSPGSAADSTVSEAASSSSTSASPPSAPPPSSSGRTLLGQLELFPPSQSTFTPPVTSGSSGPTCERVTWGRPTAAPASSFWPTLRGSENENRTTTNAPSHGNGHGKTLAGEACDATREWPTPNARDWKDNGDGVDWAKVDARSKLAGAAVVSSLQRETTSLPGGNSLPLGRTSLRLSPDFADWMMGWEPGWTCACARGRIGYALLETASFLNRPPSPGDSSGRRCSSG